MPGVRLEAQYCLPWTLTFPVPNIHQAETIEIAFFVSHTTNVQAILDSSLYTELQPCSAISLRILLELAFGKDKP